MRRRALPGRPRNAIEAAQVVLRLRVLRLLLDRLLQEGCGRLVIARLFVRADAPRQLALTPGDQHGGQHHT